MTRKPLLLLLAVLYSTLMAWADGNVSISLTDNRVATLGNGTVSLTVNDKGRVTSCLFDGTEIIHPGSAFYFSCNQPAYAELDATEAEVLVNSADMAEVVYRQTSTTAGIRWSQGFIVRRGVSGFYSYLVAEGTGADNSLGEARMVYRLSDNLFDYGYVNEQMQGVMPNAAEMTRAEESQVQDATFRLDDDTIYTKYNWANYVKDDHFHGLLSTAAGIGAWSIPVSAEYINGGPMRQDLTVHATDQSPLILQMLHGTHFGAGAQQYASGTRKIYGPFFFYINKKGTREELIADAAREAAAQEQAWPFSWFSNDLYETDRTTVTGTLQLHALDTESPTFRVVLGQPGSDVYDQGDGYIYWAETESDGSFTIANVRPGTYTLTAYALSGGLTEQYSCDGLVIGGSSTDLGTIDWYPAYYGPELWRIGESNRLSDGFKFSDAARAYELYDNVLADLTFTIGSSVEATDWYYAQTKVGTWTIKFTLADKPYGPARLTATAAGAANVTRMNFSVNGGEAVAWTLVSDGSVYRSAVLGGRYQQFALDLPAGTLKKGENTITLEITDHNYATSGIAGVMWDCIKLEQSRTETYDFTGQGTKDGLLPTWGDDVNCGGQTLQLLGNSTTGFGGRFACGPKRGDADVFKFRDSGSYHGLYSQYSNRYLSVLNLEQGDRVTITMKSDKSNLSFSGTPIVKGTYSGAMVENGKTYTVSEDGHLNLVTTGETYVEQVVIERYAPVAPVTVQVGRTVAGFSTTYDFAAVNSGDGNTDPVNTSTLKSNGVNLWQLATTTDDFDGRFAVGPDNRNGSTGKGFYFRNSGDYKGLYSQYDNRNMAILDLKAGDEVTIRMHSKAQALQFATTLGINGISSGEAVGNGVTYTVSENGNLDFVTTGSVYISSITISRPDRIVEGTTLVSTKALDFTDLPVKAFIATGAEAGVVTFTRVEKVPAGTPLFLKAETPVSIDIPMLDDDAATDDVSANLLQGSAIEATQLQSNADVRYYVYGAINGVAGFYPVSTTSTLTSAAGKAWLPLTTGQAAGARRLDLCFIDQETTGISDVQTTKRPNGHTTNDGYYTLQGMRINPQNGLKPGLYVKSGRKVLVR